MNDLIKVILILLLIISCVPSQKGTNAIEEETISDNDITFEKASVTIDNLGIINYVNLKNSKNYDLNGSCNLVSQPVIVYMLRFGEIEVECNALGKWQVQWDLSDLTTDRYLISIYHGTEQNNISIDFFVEFIKDTTEPSAFNNLSLFPISNGDLTNQSTIVVLGQGLKVEDGGLIKIYSDTNCLDLRGQSFVFGGNVSIPISFQSNSLDDTTHTLYGLVEDEAGNTNPEGCIPLNLSFTLDTQAPALPGNWSLDSPTNNQVSNDYTPIIRGSGLDDINNGKVYIYTDIGCSQIQGNANVQNNLALVDNITLNPIAGIVTNVEFYAIFEDQAKNKSDCVDLNIGYTLDRASPNPPAWAFPTSSNLNQIIVRGDFTSELVEIFSESTISSVAVSLNTESANAANLQLWANSTSSDVNSHLYRLCTNVSCNINCTNEIEIESAFNYPPLTGLTPYTDYYQCVKAKDTAGNLSASTSSTNTITYVPNFLTQIDGDKLPSLEVSGSDYFADLTLSNDGNIYFTGASNGRLGDINLSGTNFNTIIGKLDPGGQLQWVKNLASLSPAQGPSAIFGNNDLGKRILISPTSGNLIVSGEISNSNIGGSSTTSWGQSSPGGAVDAYIAALDSNGNAVWINQLDGTGTGSVESTLNLSGDDFVADMIMDTNEQIFVVGYTNGPISETNTGNSTFDIWVAKFDTTGGLVWLNQLGGTGTNESVLTDLTKNEYPTRIIIDPNTQNILVLGHTNSDLKGTKPAGGSGCSGTVQGNDVFIARFDQNNGDFLEIIEFVEDDITSAIPSGKGCLNDEAYSMIFDPLDQNNLIISGNTRSLIENGTTSQTNPTFSNDIWLARINITGTAPYTTVIKQVASDYIGSSGEDTVSAGLVSNPNGEFFILAQTTIGPQSNSDLQVQGLTSASGQTDIMLMQFDNNLNFDWSFILANSVTGNQNSINEDSVSATITNSIITSNLIMDKGGLLFGGQTGSNLDAGSTRNSTNKDIFIGRININGTYTP